MTHAFPARRFADLRQHERTSESCGECAETVSETVAYRSKCHFGALPMTCAGNAVSNGPVRQNAGDQNAFTFKKTHVVYPLAINKSAVNQPRTCVPGTRSRLPIESLLLFMLLSLRSSSSLEEHKSELQSLTTIKYAVFC